MTGTNHLTINENGGTGTITFSTAAINNAGTVTNIGSGSGTTTISASLGANVLDVIQNSANSSLALSGNNTAYAGNYDILSGKLAIATGIATNAASAINVGDTSGTAGAEFNVANNNLTANNNIAIRAGSSGTKTLSVSSVSAFTTSGTLTLHDNVTKASSGDFTINGATTLNGVGGSRTITVNSGSLTLGGVVADGAATGLTLAGGGTLILKGANSYSGDTTISYGTLKLGNSNVIPDGAGKGNVVLNPILNNSATLELGGFSETINGLSSSGAGLSFVDTNTGAPTLTFGANDQSASFGGVIKNNPGTLALAKVGSGTQTLAGANTYSGATSIQNGTLVVSGGNDRLPTNTTVTLGSGSTSGVLQLGDAAGARNQTLAGLAISGSGAGNAAVGGNAAVSTLTVSSGGAVNYGGTLGGAGANQNNLALTKSGNGTLTLSRINSYTGVTRIANGTLALAGSLTNNIASSATIDIQTDATRILDVTGLSNQTLVLASGQTLQGNGAVAGKLAAASGSHIAPGASPGHLTQSGDLTLNSGAFLDIEIEGNTAANYDHVDVTGAVALQGATLNLTGPSPGYTPQVGDQYIIITNDSNDPVSNGLSGAPTLTAGAGGDTPGSTLAEGAILSTNFLNSGNSARITYQGGDGNDVAILVLGPFNYTLPAAGNYSLIRNGANLELREGLAVRKTAPFASVTSVAITGTVGNDSLTVDYTGTGDPVPSGGVTFDGWAQTGLPGDVLVIKGTGTQDPNYKPSLTLGAQGKSGDIIIAGKTIHFDNLEPVDFDTAGNVSLTLLGANDNVTFADGATVVGGNPAIVLTGTSGGVPFEPPHIRNGSITVNTNTIDGVDAIAITAANGTAANITNLTINTAGVLVGDTVSITGQVTISGSLSITAQGTIAEAGSGAVAAASLFPSSAGGTTLNGANQVGAFTASNATNGNLAFTNAVASLSLGSLSNAAGSVSVTNTGAVSASGAVTAGVGGLSVQATTDVALVAGASVSTGGTVLLAADSDTNGSGMVSVTSATVGSTSPSGSAITLRGADITLGANGLIVAAGTTGGVVVRSSLESRPLSLGGTDSAVAGINLTDAELSQISTAAGGSVTFGSSSQTGNITLTTATPATTVGAAIVVLQSTAGVGRILLDDAGTGTALVGGNSPISLTAGTQGIAANATSGTWAEISTTGPAVTISTTGPVGTGSGRVEFAADADTGQQVVGISTPGTGGVYLGGLGALTLGAIATGNGPLDVVASGPGTLTTTAAIATSGGRVTLSSRDALTMNGSLVSGAGTVALLVNQDGSGADSLLMNAGSSISTTNATSSAVSISVGGTGNAAVRSIGASTSGGRVTVQAGGAILDNNAGNPDVWATDAILTAVNGIGAGADATSTASHPWNYLDTQVSHLDVNNTGTASGQVQIANDGALVLVDLDGSGALTINGAGAGALRANSPFTISTSVTHNGSFTYTAGDSAASGDDLTIDNNATVTLSSATVATLTFQAGDDIILGTGAGSAGRIRTNGGGIHSVLLTADHEGATGGDTERGSVAQDAASSTSVSTNQLTINAAENQALFSAIGSPSQPLLVNVDRLTTDSAASGAPGDQFITDADGLAVVTMQAGSAKIALTASAGAIADDANDALADIIANAATLSATTGLGAFAGTGSLDLDVTTLASATCHAGGIYLDLLDPDNSGVWATSVDADTSGDIGLTGTSGSGTRTYALVDANHGNIDISADAGNIRLGLVTASTDSLVGTAGTVTVTATQGAIDDQADDGTADVLAQTAALTASTGIGQTNGSLDVNVDTLTSATSATGGIALNLLDDASAANSLSANHAVTATLVDATGAGDIGLTGTGGAGTRTYTRVDAHDGNVSVGATAGDLVLVTVISDSGVLGAHDVTVSDGSGSIAVNNSVRSDRDITVTANDSAGTDNVSLLAAATMTAGRNVAISAGDNATLPGGSTVTAGSTVTVNVDFGNADAAGGVLKFGDSTMPAFGDLAFLPADMDAVIAIFNGNSHADTFNLVPDQDTGGTLTPITVNGNDPVGTAGDELNLDITDVTSPALTVGEINGGSWSWGNAAAVTYHSIEKVTTAPSDVPYDLILEMDDPNVALANRLKNINLGVDDTIVVQRITSTELQIRVDGTQVFRGVDTTIQSLLVNGSEQGDKLSIDETTNGLPMFTGTAYAGPNQPLSATFNTLTNNLPVNMHFNGRGGSNAIAMSLTTVHGAVYAPDNLGTVCSGAIGLGNYATAPFGAGQLGLSFENLAPVSFPFGSAPVTVSPITLERTANQGGTLTVDASSDLPVGDVKALTVSDSGGDYTQITGSSDTANPTANPSARFSTTTFTGFPNLVLRGGSGSQTVNLVSANANMAGGTAILDGDNLTNTDTATDLLWVQTTPSNLAVTLLGGQGSDSFQLYQRNAIDDWSDDLTTGILGPVLVSPNGLDEGPAVNESNTLIVRDNGDVTSRTVTVAVTGAVTTIGGLLGAVASSPNITLYNQINALSVDSGRGSDTFRGVSAALPLPDLNAGGTANGVLQTAAFNGYLGNDTFNITPSKSTLVSINGGSPGYGDSGMGTGDTLNFTAPDSLAPPAKENFLVNRTAIRTTGGWADVNYADIENLPLTQLPTGTPALPLRYDLNGSSSSQTQTTPVMYVGVLPTAVYDPSNTYPDPSHKYQHLTYGWTVPMDSNGYFQEGGLDRGALSGPYSNLFRDGHMSVYPHTYRATVPSAGWYLVSVTMGDAGTGRDHMRVTSGNTGQVLLDDISTAAGEIRTEWFVTYVPDAGDLGGSDAAGPGVQRPGRRSVLGGQCDHDRLGHDLCPEWWATELVRDFEPQLPDRGRRDARYVPRGQCEP